MSAKCAVKVVLSAIILPIVLYAMNKDHMPKILPQMSAHFVQEVISFTIIPASPVLTIVTFARVLVNAKIVKMDFS